MKVSKGSLVLFSVLSFSFLTSAGINNNKIEDGTYIYQDEYKIEDFVMEYDRTEIVYHQYGQPSRDQPHYYYKIKFNYTPLVKNAIKVSFEVETKGGVFKVDLPSRMSSISRKYQATCEFYFDKSEDFIDFRFNYGINDRFISLYNSEFKASTTTLNINQDDLLTQKIFEFEQGVPVILNGRFTNLIQVYDFSTLRYNDIHDLYYGKVDYSCYKYRYTDNDPENPILDSNLNSKRVRCSHYRDVNTSLKMCLNIKFNEDTISCHFTGYDAQCGSTDRGGHYDYSYIYKDGYMVLEDVVTDGKVKMHYSDNPSYMVNVLEKDVNRYLKTGYKMSDAIYFANNLDSYKGYRSMYCRPTFSLDKLYISCSNEKIGFRKELYFNHQNDYYLNGQFNTGDNKYNEVFIV